MARKSLPFLLLAGLFVGLVSPPFLPALREQAGALEKVRLGTPVRMNPNLYLPILVAEENGFWKENGLEVEWLPFGGPTPLLQALAIGAINFGMGSSDMSLVGAARGLPFVMVAIVTSTVRFNIFVRADSPYRHVRDLKGKRIGVTGLGGAAHAQARVTIAAEGMEKDVRFVGAGGAPAMIAGLRAGAYEAMLTSLFTAADLKVEGILRDIASADDYLPQPWVGTAVFARNDFARSKADIVRKEIRATLQATDFIRKNPRWSQDKMRSFQGISEAAAKVMYDALNYTATGKFDRKAVENMRRLFIEYGLVTEKAPAVDELFTNEYVP